MNSNFPRGTPLSFTVRAVLKSNPFLASDFVLFNNLSLPDLPVPNVSFVTQSPSSFTIFVDDLPPNLPSAIGFNFSFGSGDSVRGAVEVFRELDTQFVFDQSLLKFLRDLNPNQSFVMLKTVFRQTSLSSALSRPFKFLLLPPPAAPSAFT
ncbi:hypothetical protein, partial [Runella sp.]|uniref:hypothetical protein n=1 Tax=Runella sp. TaxID=1960881 RepID=UPI00301B2389